MDERRTSMFMHRHRSWRERLRQTFTTLTTHADRAWKAEEVYASRLLTQVQVLTAIVTGQFAAIAAGVLTTLNSAPFKVLLSGHHVGYWWMALVIFPLSGSAVLSLVGLAFLYTPTSSGATREASPSADSEPIDGRSDERASGILALDDATLEGVTRASPWDPVSYEVFFRTYAAYLNLKERNSRKRSAVDRGRQLVLRAVGLAVISGMIYTLLAIIAYSGVAI